MTNEEKILNLLETQQEILTRHEALLENQQKILTRHEALLENHQNEIAKINLTLENKVFPALEALAEGQKTILETLAPKNRVEALEDEVSFMKMMMKTLAGEINELKKAQ